MPAPATSDGDASVNLLQRLEEARAVMSSIRIESEQTATAVESSAVRIQAATEKLATMTDRAIGDLRTYLAQLDSQWAVEMEQQLDLVELGGQRLDEFIGKFGNWLITTEEGTVRIRELLDGVDPRQFENDMQALISKAKEGGDALAEAIDLLRQKGGQLTQSLVAAIDAFQRGEGSLERILRIIAQLQAATGGNTTLDELLQTIGRELDEGARDGSYG